MFSLLLHFHENKQKWKDSKKVVVCACEAPPPSCASRQVVSILFLFLDPSGNGWAFFFLLLLSFRGKSICIYVCNYLFVCRDVRTSSFIHYIFLLGNILVVKLVFKKLVLSSFGFCFVVSKNRYPSHCSYLLIFFWRHVRCSTPVTSWDFVVRFGGNRKWENFFSQSKVYLLFYPVSKLNLWSMCTRFYCCGHFLYYYVLFGCCKMK